MLFRSELNRLGVTSVSDAGGGFQNFPQDYEVINELHRRGGRYALFTEGGGGTFMGDVGTYNSLGGAPLAGDNTATDYVLSGGEIAALALIDACVRLLPGVMGKEASGADESFSEGLLEYPQYTRPQEFEGEPIPQVLISGDHARVAAWRRAESEALTRDRRPDLWTARQRGKATKNKTDG